ncbi:MAG: OmpH family outer membrane protein [Armatimonadota bacterium]
MTQKSFIITAAVLAVLGIASWTGLFAQGTSPSGFSFAVVDIRKVVDGYSETAKAQQELAALDRKARETYDNKEAGRFLDDNERKELETLQALTNPTAEQKKRLEELIQMNNARAQTFRGLQLNPNRSPAEEEEYKKLSDRSEKMDKELDDLAQKLQEELRKKQEEIGKRLDQAIQQAINTVASQKSIPAVFDKSAVLYGGQDITDEVLAVLNKK